MASTDICMCLYIFGTRDSDLLRTVSHKSLLGFQRKTTGRHAVIVVQTIFYSPTKSRIHSNKGRSYRVLGRMFAKIKKPRELSRVASFCSCYRGSSNKRYRAGSRRRKALNI